MIHKCDEKESCVNSDLSKIKKAKEYFLIVLLKKFYNFLIYVLLEEALLLIESLIVFYPTGHIGNYLRLLWLRKVRKVSFGKHPMIGKDVIIYNRAKLRIGDNFKVGPNVEINPCDSLGIIIGDNVSIAHGSFLRAGNHNYSLLTKPIIEQGHIAKRIRTNDGEEASIIIEDDVWIGAYTVILSGARIGRGSVISSSSVISSEIPPFSVVAGNPARAFANRQNIDFSKEKDKICLP